MRVGFGVTALCSGLAGGGLDGIGNYTRELILRMRPDNATHGPIELVPFAFGSEIPADLNARVAAVVHNAPSNFEAQQIAPGVQLGRYSINTAWSVTTGSNFLGMRALTNQVDLIHATDHYVQK